MDVESADLDGDGDLDLVVACEFELNKVLLNDGQGKFHHAKDALPTFTADELPIPPGAPPFLQQGHDSEDIVIADFNKDQILDIIIVSEDDIKFGRKNVHEYYQGTGNAAFQRMIGGGLPDTEANGICAADVNEDGHLDLLIVGAGQDRLLLNDGQGVFQDVSMERLPEEQVTGQDAEFVDLDGDQKLDVVVGYEGGHFAWINDGMGNFIDETSSRFPALANVEARKVTPIDIDGDLDTDLYFSHVGWKGPGAMQPRNPQDALFLNDGKGFFENATDSLIGNESLTTLDAKFADLDNDHTLELIQVNFGPVKIYKLKTTGLEDATNDFLPNPIEGPGVAVEVADFNADGYLDLYLGLLAGPGKNPAGFDRLLMGSVPSI